MAKTVVPYIPPEKSLPEITVKGVILALLLSIILGAANTYLGLRVGLTVSAAIPAAVVAMGVLRLFKEHNILENNAIRTAASAGEALAAGVLFTLPALLVIGYWEEVSYWETTLIALFGGIVGVLFTVPLRRALVLEADLTFPEGVAVAELTKAGEKDEDAAEGAPSGAGLAAMVVGALSAAVYKFLQTGTRMWAGTAEFGAKFRQTGVVAFGADLSPALLGVGYIIGLRIAVLVFLGGALGWLVAIPLYSLFGATLVSTPDGIMDFTTAGDAVETASFLWSNLVRFIGVGAMLVGGLWSLWKLRKALAAAVLHGLGAKGADEGPDIRTDQSLSMKTTYLSVVALTVPLMGIYWYVSGEWYAAIALAVLMLVTGFLFSAVAGYMAGLVGSSNNPISGVTILTVLASAGTLRLLGISAEVGPAATILVAGTIASAAAISGDTMQDLKAGHLLGGTPKKQQIMQVIGVVGAAATVALVLRVLTNAYEIGSAELAAPQAGLMASVANGVFTGDLPWAMIFIGMGLAVFLIVLDTILEKKGSSFRTPIMPVAVGIYLPVGLSVPIFLGGLLAWAVGYGYTRAPYQEMKTGAFQSGTLMASGLIAGEALVGIALAAVIAGGAGDAIALGSGELRSTGLLMFAYMMLLLGYTVMRRRIVHTTP